MGKDGLSFAYSVPHHLCSAEGEMDLGGVLALADEVSTVLLCCLDQTHRTGVSVSLTGEMLAPEGGGIRAGQSVWVETVATKIGAALGFAEVQYKYSQGLII
jgi:hypothetical protein